MDSESKIGGRELKKTGTRERFLMCLQMPGHKVSSKSSMRVPDGAIKGPQVPVEGEFSGVSRLSYC